MQFVRYFINKNTFTELVKYMYWDEKYTLEKTVHFLSLVDLTNLSQRT